MRQDSKLNVAKLCLIDAKTNGVLITCKVAEHYFQVPMPNSPLL